MEGTLGCAAQNQSEKKEKKEKKTKKAKKSGLKVVTLIATPNPVSQVLW